MNNIKDNGLKIANIVPEWHITEDSKLLKKIKGAKILEIKDGICGTKLITDKGVFLLTHSHFPDGSYETFTLEEVEE